MPLARGRADFDSTSSRRALGGEFGLLPWSRCASMHASAERHGADSASTTLTSPLSFASREMAFPAAAIDDGVTMPSIALMAGRWLPGCLPALSAGFPPIRRFTAAGARNTCARLTNYAPMPRPRTMKFHFCASALSFSIREHRCDFGRAVSAPCFRSRMLQLAARRCCCAMGAFARLFSLIRHALHFSKSLSRLSRERFIAYAERWRRLPRRLFAIFHLFYAAFYHFISPPHFIARAIARVDDYFAIASGRPMSRLSATIMRGSAVDISEILCFLRRRGCFILPATTPFPTSAI